MPSLNWDYKDQQLAFTEWKDFLESYLVIHNVAEAKKWHYILLSAGTKGREIWETWQLSAAQKADASEIFKKFEEHLIGTPNKWVSRLELAAITQHQNESIDDFACRLKSKAKSCKFEVGNDDQITFQLIKGVKSVDIQRKLIAKGNDLILDAALKCAIECEATQHNALSFSKPSTYIDSMKSVTPGSKTCRFCGKTHPPRQCPAYGKKCRKCHAMNHFAEVCRSKSSQTEQAKSQSRPRRKSKQSRINAIHTDEDITDDSSLDCGEIVVNSIGGTTHHQSIRQSVIAKLCIRPPDVSRRVTLRVKADTGANGSIMPIRCMQQMYPREEDRRKVIQRSRATLTAVNGSAIHHHGVVKMPVQFDDSAWITCVFYVCETDGPAILSCDASEKLGIIKVKKSRNISAVTNTAADKQIKDTDDLQRMYPDRFEGLGNMPGEYDIELKEGAVPVVAPPRKYPIQLRDEIRMKLTEMEADGVIQKCDDDEASDWVNSLAFTRKANGDLRICLDPKHLNNAMKRTYHKTPTIDEISYKLTGSTVYSKLDAKHGYWGIHLAERSSKLCTFQSPAGKYRFLRLPFGLCVSQDIFQSRMDKIMQKVGEGLVGIADDIIVHGRDVEDHDRALHRLMQVAREEGLVFRAEKCHIRKKSVSFFGLTWSCKGMHPDEKKCDNIASKPAPTNSAELQSFIGLLQYMSPFIPHLASKTQLLRQLLKKETPWEWTAEHEKAFSEVKQSIRKDMLLRFFDTSVPAVIEVDASLQGLGAALVQNGQPVAFASKSLTSAETRYANIERELLAVVYGLERFHCFIYGKPVIVHSDHKPLEAIVKKQLSKTPPRLQRMLLRIQPYDANIQYKPGRELVYADYLSRIKPTEGPAIDLEATIHTIQVSNKQLERVRDATTSDAQLSTLREQVTVGWPESVTTVPKSIRQYWSVKDCISVEDGVLFLGNRLIIPETMQKEYLDRIHSGHLGVTKCQLRAKESVYWSKMLTDIEAHVKSCIFCLQNARSQTAEPMRAHEQPTQPWEILSSDLFELDGKPYVLVVDHYSRMPFVRHLETTVSNTVIRYLKELFAVHGVPKKFYSDNGPQYSSRLFEVFADEWEFSHVTSSPRYPQSNGFCERMVGVVKSILKKAKMAGTDPKIALMCYRSTPLNSHLPSPAELLYNRPIRTNIPARTAISPRRMDERSRMQGMSADAEHHYNQRAAKSDLSELFPGMKVLLQENKTWGPVTVLSKMSDRSYNVETPNGQTIRRNRRFLKEIPKEATSKLVFKKVSFVEDEEPRRDSQEIEDKQPMKDVRDVEDKPPIRRSSRVRREPQRLSY